MEQGETATGKNKYTVELDKAKIKMNTPPMVSVICTAYNHENFIQDAIEGVIHQKTDFNYEFLIHDDASTDKTAKIIQAYAQKYPTVIRAILQDENQFQHCHIYPDILFPMIRGKYVAFCEGDDYWTDEYKLQKQVDFLEKHPEYTMCIHNAIKWNYETGEKKRLDTFLEDGTYEQKQQILAGLGTDFPAFASYVFRSELLKKIPDFFLASHVLDYPLRQYAANEGKIYYFAHPMSVYRTAIPQSYMKMTSKNQIFYNHYTLQMIRFFEKFNQYTNYKFHHILKYKLVSDYFGFCLSIPEVEGLKQAAENKLELKKIKACYKCIDPTFLAEEIREVANHAEHLFIYGTSRLAPICKDQLAHAGIDFEGFVVSEGQMKIETLDGKQVLFLNEVIKKYEHPGFILAVQPVNADAIVAIFKAYNIQNYCKPYMLKND